MLFIYISIDTTISIPDILIRTIIIYCLYVLLTKSKWYFAMVSITFLLAYGFALRYFTMQKIASTEAQDGKYDVEYQELVLNIIRGLIVASILIGSGHYLYLQYFEYKSKFSFYTFIVGTGKCKKNEPKYREMPFHR